MGVGTASGGFIGRSDELARLSALLDQARLEALARRARLTAVRPAPAAHSSAHPPAHAADRFGLTPREREVLGELANGASNRRIARALFITEKTASVHVSNIMAKLSAANRGDAAALARRFRLIVDGPREEAGSK